MRRFIVLAVLSASACGDASLETEQSDDSLFISSTTLFSGREIPVCWNTAGFDEEKGWVEGVLRGQRSWGASGNVRFVGWGACANNATGIRINVGSTASTLGLGQRGGVLMMNLHFRADPGANPPVRAPEQTWAQCTTNSLSRRPCIETVALHEFGHALGYAHEHNRADREGCTDASQGSNGDTTFGVFDIESVMAYCNDRTDLSGIDRRGHERTYGPDDLTEALGDYDGDGRQDLLCHDVVSGSRWVDRADSSGRFLGTDSENHSGWCVGRSQRLYQGDFNGDGRTDLLCADHQSGGRWIDYASISGGFDGTDWSITSNWCLASTRRIHVGDFDGDGRDDLLCHDTTTGGIWVDYADYSGRFTDYWEGYLESTWCGARTNRLFVGDFNGDQRDDLLCHDVASGEAWVDLSSRTGYRFGGTEWTRGAAWCGHTTGQLHVGDVDGDGRDDLICHDVTSGQRWLDYASVDGRFLGTDRVAGSWCGASTNRLLVGDVDGDGRHDLICHDVGTGAKWVDLAAVGGVFGATDWSVALGWCGASSNMLH